MSVMSIFSLLQPRFLRPASISHTLAQPDLLLGCDLSSPLCGRTEIAV